MKGREDPISHFNKHLVSYFYSLVEKVGRKKRKREKVYFSSFISFYFTFDWMIRFIRRIVSLFRETTGIVESFTSFSRRLNYAKKVTHITINRTYRKMMFVHLM